MISEAKREELVALTTMRGIAAALVLAFHMRYRLTTSWQGQGYLWVDFFFILSGFILCYVYGRLFADGIKLPVLWSFLGKRLARIYPLHFVLLGVAIVLGLGLHVQNFRSPLSSIPTNLLLIHAWGIEPKLTWNEVSWSISAEWAFYLVFPFLVPVYRRAGRIVSAVGICAALGGLAAIELQNGWLNMTRTYAVPRCLLEASIGMLLYNFYSDTEWSGLRKVARMDVVRWPLLFLPLVPMQLHCDTAVVLTFTLMLLPLAYADRSLERAMSWAPLKHVGVVSYSLYMSHLVVATFVLKALRPLGLDPRKEQLPALSVIGVNLAMVLICVGAATILYHLVEVPGRRWMTRWLVRP
jgi:peptidoglycan/LPS O-acetylase OafA/YrhL